MNQNGALTIVFVILVNLLSYGQDTGKNSPKKADTVPDNIAYVIFQEDTLFTLSEQLGPFSSQERADAIITRLDAIAGNNLVIVEDSFNIIETDASTLINYKSSVIMSITDNDAVKKGDTRKSIAENNRDIISTAFIEHIQIKSTQSWVIRIGLTLLTLAGLIVIFLLLTRFFRWINKRLDKYEKKIKRKRMSIVRYLIPKSNKSILIIISNVVKYILILLILFLYLPLLFNFLPWTKGIVQKFYDLITEPVTYVLKGILNFLPDLFYILIIYFVARYIVRVLSYIVEEYENDKIKLKGFHKDWGKPTLNIIKIIIYAFALIFMFPHLPGS